MKKKHSWRYYTDFPPLPLKFLRVMKLSVLLTCILSVNMMASVYSQKTRFDLDIKDQSVRDVLKIIENESLFRFFYNDEFTDLDKKLTFSTTDQSIDGLMAVVLDNTEVSYKVLDNNFIVITPKVLLQQGKVTGIVKDVKTGEPLPGVTVMIDGTTKGYITDASGKYTIDAVDNNAVLVFSYVGYNIQKVPIAGKSVIDVALEVNVKSLEEVVVIGYGTQKKRDLTGAVVRVQADSYKNQSMTQMTDMLTGTVAGLYSNQGTSAEGGSYLEIRGQKSLNAATDPMVVIDGAIFNGSISEINPVDIETIDILKDASSAAVYGAQAASGVILITTKKGKTGKPIINFSSSVGITTPTHAFKPYDGEGYLQYRGDFLRSVNPDKPSYYYDDPNNLPSDVTLEEWRNASDNPQENNTNEYLSRNGFFQVEMDNYNAGKEINWYNEVINKGIRQNYDLSISGATDRVNYYWSIGYQKNEGVVRGDKFSTIRSRLNLDLKVTDWLNIGTNTQLSNRDQSVVTAELWSMYENSPYGSKYNQDGSLNWYPNSYTAVNNPLINYYGQDRLMKVYGLFATLYAKIKLPLGIEYKLSYQPGYSFSKDYNFWSSETIEGGVDHSQGYGTREDGSDYGWILDNLLHWQKEVGIHNFDITLLYSAEKNKDWSSTMSNETFTPNQNLGFNGLQYGTKPGINIYDQMSTGTAAMARLNYVMMDKYLFTASVRRDGYSAFGLKNPWATFPSFALAWRISKENFFNVPWINQLKIRTSWGSNGNRAIGPYSALAQLNPNLYYDGSITQVGIYNSTLENSNLKWERTQSLNFGVDLDMFDNRISMVAEYYISTTKDLLMNRLLPEITGFTSITSNLGELSNRGFEFTVNTLNINNPGFSWRSNLVFSFNRNEIKHLFGDYVTDTINGKPVTREIPDYTNEWFPGQAIDRVWNYNVTGIWQVNETTEAAKYGMTPGDYKAEDLDKSYTYEALIDKQFIGYTKPRYQFGFKNDFTFLKNFSVSIFIRADLGHVGEFEEALRGSWETYDKRNVYDIPYWTPENPINDYPKLSTTMQAFGGGLRIYKPMSFVRVQDLSLSYQLPTDFCRTIKINDSRVFFSIRNLLTFSKWPGWDPESRNIPMPMTYTIGLNISL
jgi:TonB-dependent starch-binding outer membrane protein SusC